MTKTLTPGTTIRYRGIGSSKIKTAVVLRVEELQVYVECNAWVHPANIIEVL